MADKRAELVKSMEKLSTARERITQQLEESEAKVKQLQGTVNEEMMQTGSSDSLQELSLSRERVNLFNQALQYANGEVNAAQQQLNDYDMAARGGEIQALDRKVQQAIVNLQVKIGESGLKAEVDRLGEMIAELEQLSNAGVQVHGAAEHINVARNVHDRLSRSLMASWQDIEALGWGPAHSTASSRPNYIPGFGVRPGNLTSS